MAYHIQAGNRRSSEGTREQNDVLCPIVLRQMHEQNRTLHNHSPNVKVLVLGTLGAARLSAPHKVFDSTFKMLRDRSHFFRK
ncbi:hypothetical protein TNCV_3199681 [Trichonephila clavipes]|nr:hypothetical protein TNCV_3199681 [Trichonephila clavipes]